MRLGNTMWNRRTTAAAVAAIALASALLVAVGSVTTLALSDSGDEDELRQQFVTLQADLEDALALQGQVGAKDATIAELRLQLEGLEGERDVLGSSLISEIEVRSQGEARVAELLQLIADSGITTGQLAELQNRHDALVAQYDGLKQEHDDASERLARLVPIETTELPVPALYLDTGVSQVATTRALCSGSMEPTVTCDDLLVLFMPASPTDLDEGDIIYYKKPNSGCTSTLEGRFTLHRIVDVISNSRGLFFQAKGDAFVNPDVCLVAADDVIFKLLTTVRDGRIQ